MNTAGSQGLTPNRKRAMSRVSPKAAAIPTATVSFLALCGVLERAVQESVLGNYYLKGGVAMELRFAEGARATKDVDIGLACERA
jgi:hypothetical protein